MKRSQMVAAASFGLMVLVGACQPTGTDGTGTTTYPTVSPTESPTVTPTVSPDTTVSPTPSPTTSP